MKVCVAYEIKNGPWGGGNQFLKALCYELHTLGILTPRPEDADVILFNSHQHIEAVLNLKQQFPHKKFIHRIDGPMRLYNSMSDQRDNQVQKLNEIVADGTIFQSSWSKQKNAELGFVTNNPTATIVNAPDVLFFNENKAISKHSKRKILIASFSKNPKKGFKTYQYIDGNLNFQKYDVVFAGRSPVEFVNIKQVGCLTSEQLSKLMKTCDMFLTASECDPCSNSLLEALAAGLPAVAYEDGGHPELIKDGGVLFSNTNEIIEKIDVVANNLEAFKRNIKVQSIRAVTKSYLDFFEGIMA